MQNRKDTVPLQRTPRPVRLYVPTCEAVLTVLVVLAAVIVCAVLAS